jgi:hypothetical protein
MAFNNRVLNLLWYGSLAGPLVIATGFLAFDIETGVGWLPARLLWNAALVLMVLELAAARPLVRRVLAPDRLVARAVPKAMAAAGDLPAQALAKGQILSMLAAALLNAPPMALTVLAVLHAEAQLALLLGVLALVAAWFAKPDFVRLVVSTRQRLAQGNSGA